MFSPKEKLNKNNFFCYIFLIIVIITFISLPLIIVKIRNGHKSPLLETYHFQNEEIISPITENQNLRYVTLSNGMDVLLISDSDTPKSACAVEVRAGSNDEPKEVLGLAHFLEHMLFQGSAKYPGNSYFDDFLSRNDGETNAYTADQVTVFYFDINNGAFNDAVDIFSHLFIDARLDPAAVEREIYAVNNEYQNDLQKNDWRFQELLKKLANKESPYHRFSIGNIKTLKTIPASQNISVYDELKNFYNTHYSANKMQVCLISNQTLDEMESLIKNTFRYVPIRSEVQIEETGKKTTHEKINKGLFRVLHQQLRGKVRNVDPNLGQKLWNQDAKQNSNWNLLNLHSKEKTKKNHLKFSDKIPAFTKEDLGKYVWY